MAKKRTNKKTTTGKQVEDDNRLPQNIFSIGERVEESKNIYIYQPTYKTIHRFTDGKTVNENGGMLVGNIIEEFGKTNVVICGFVEAKYCEATPTTLKFTHETWDYCHKEIDKKYPGKKIIGWIHTHPNFGIFLSEYDKFIQENFFKEEYEIAYVVDPIQNIEGFYFWINGKIERCKGFYIFDKTGVKINIESDTERENAAKMSRGEFSIKNIVIAALSVAVVILMFAVISINGKISTLQSQQETIVTSANQSLGHLQQQIYELQNKIDELTPAKDDIEDSNSNNNDDGSKSSTQENDDDSKPASTEETTP